MENINIRQVKVNDFEDMYSLNKELGYEYAKEKVKERIQYVLDKKQDIVFVAQVDCEVIGYIHGSPYELLYLDSLINILGFVVKEKYRNMGVGNALIQQLESWAKCKGYTGIRPGQTHESL